MYCSRHGFTGLVLASIVLAGCGNRASAPGAAPSSNRIAILRFENLSSDGGLSWIGRALSEVVAAQLATAPGVQAISSVQLHSFDRMLGPRPISSPGISSEITQAGLAGAARVVYGEYTLRHGKLEVSVTIEDLANRRMLETFNVAAPAGNVLGAANEIARLIAPKAGAYSTRNGAALADYIGALESADPARMEQGLTAAIQADPDFPPPYRLQAQERLQRGDRTGAAAIVDQALARGDRFPPIERARLEVQAAEIAMNLNARHTALEAMVKADPNDPISWRGLGQSYINRHDYRHAVESLQKAVELEPRDADTWNMLGYAAASAGDLPAATTALRRYQSLLPNGANPLDSLGDVHFAAGKLDEAEKFYLEAFQKDPNFLNQGDLLKAALARLFTGDRTAADQAAERYFDARTRAKDPILEYRRAQWKWLSGRRREAIEQMQAFAKANESTPLRDSASRAYAELSLWHLMLGDRPAAEQLAATGIRIATPQARGNAFVSAFLAMPPASASEWSVRAERAFPGPTAASIRDFALTYALLVNGEFQAAQLLLKQTWESGAPAADEGLPIMLAWTLIETGKPQEAAPLLQFNPVANANGLTPYAAFYLPRIFYLRGVLAQKEGRTSEADANFKKFQSLGGDLAGQASRPAH